MDMYEEDCDLDTEIFMENIGVFIINRLDEIMKNIYVFVVNVNGKFYYEIHPNNKIKINASDRFVLNSILKKYYNQCLRKNDDWKVLAISITKEDENFKFDIKYKYELSNLTKEIEIVKNEFDILKDEYDILKK